MWRYLLSAIIASVATFLAWSVIVDGKTLDDSVSLVIVVVVGIVVVLLELIAFYFWSIRSGTVKSSVDPIISRHSKLIGLLYLTGFTVGTIFTLAACLLHEHLNMWAHAIFLMAFLVVWWGFDFYIRIALGKNSAEQVAASDR